jgi:hypothetical protein
VRAGRLDFRLPPGGAWTVTVLAPDGRTAWRSRPVASGPGGNGMALPLGTLPKGALLVKLEGEDVSGAPASFARRIVNP